MTGETPDPVTGFDRVRGLREFVRLALREADMLNLTLTGIHLCEALESLNVVLHSDDASSHAHPLPD